MAKFGILGPLRVTHAGGKPKLGGPKQRTLLAALLVRARKSVGIDGIVDVLWGEHPPASAVASVHMHVNRLRGAFADVGLAGVLVTDGSGYRLLVEPDQLDIERFEAAAAHARAALAAGDAGKAVAFWQDAWAAWRGDPLEDVPLAGWLAAEAVRLREVAAAAREDFADARFAAGQYKALVIELTALVREHPLREGLWRRLMLAQHRLGRRAEALSTYRALRSVLIEQLGVEPCCELRELHQEILRGAPLESHARPMQLPPDAENFTGREAERAEFRRLLTEQPRSAVAITGKAGVGKTALAVRVADELGNHFGGGQLYVRLGGTRSPRDPVTVLAELLIALGVHPHAVPEDPEARAAMYRSQLAARRVLVVLDDAANMAQIRPLLPGTAGSAVLITSRVPLLEAHTVHLDVLGAEDAVRLLASIAGQARMTEEPAAAAAVARYCGNLPLALRIAGSRLARRTQWTVGTLAERLAGEGTRLNELRIDDLEARASLALSYEALGEEQRRAFRLLSLLDVPDFAGWVAGPLLGVPVPAAEEVVACLAEVHLLETAGQGRYRFHDLLRVFGREQACEHDSGAERADALRRAFTAWLDVAVRAEEGLPSRFLKVRLAVERSLLDEVTAGRLLADPLRFLETERDALVVVVEQALSLDMTTLAADTACVLTTLFDLHSHYDLWRHTHERALAAAVAPRHEAILRQGLGALAFYRDRFSEAGRHFAQARRIFAELGDTRGRAYANLGLGSVRMYRSSHDDAAALLASARADFLACADPCGEAFALQALGVVRRNQGRLEEAATFLNQALESFQALHCAYGQACALFSLGLHHGARGDLKSTERVLTKSVDLFRAASCPRDEALALHVLAATHAQDGNASRATALMSRSLAVFSPADESPSHAAMLYSLGWVAHRNQRPNEAADYFDQALRLYEKLDMPMPKAKVRTALHSLGLSIADL